MPWKCSPKLRRSLVRACFEQILPEKPEKGEGYEEDRSEELEEPEKPEDLEDYEKLEELSDPEGLEELLKPEGFASREDSMSFTPGANLRKMDFSWKTWSVSGRRPSATSQKWGP